MLIERTNTLQGNDIVSSANTVSGLIYKKQNDVVYYFGLREMNDSLVHKKIDQTDTSVHVVKYADYVYRTARVINNSINASDNYVTLNRGSADGISKNFAVISGTGVVGRVEHVTAHFSSVLSILSAKLKVSARLKGGTTGFVIWDEKSPDILTMIDVPRHIEVKKGDSVFTTSFSYFPPDVLIGTVVKTEIEQKRGVKLIYLQSTTNFHSLQYVYVVENKMAAEKKQVEDSTKKSK